jgi:hypothetical protein
MTIPEVQHARDYNRELPRVVQWAHIAWAVLLYLTRPIRQWTAPRPWSGPLLWGALLAAIAGNWDGSIARALTPQPGLSSILLGLSLVICLIAAMFILSQSSGQLVIRWATGFIALFLICRILPMLIGRPRPLLNDPSYFNSPFGQYPLSSAAGIRHAWEFWIPGISTLWSMPAREAAYAFFAASTIPRWRPAFIILAALTAAGSALTSSHYLSDAIIGAAIGTAAGRSVMRPPPTV